MTTGNGEIGKERGVGESEGRKGWVKGEGGKNINKILKYNV